MAANFPNPLQIGLGAGAIAISQFRTGSGVHGLIFRDTGTPHEIGSNTDEPAEGSHPPIEGEVYIACLNRESALVLQDMVNRVVESFDDCDPRQTSATPSVDSKELADSLSCREVGKGFEF